MKNVKKLIEQWEQDKLGYPGNSEVGIYCRTILELCIKELKHAVWLDCDSSKQSITDGEKDK